MTHIILKRYEIRSNESLSLLPQLFNVDEWRKNKNVRSIAADLDAHFKVFNDLINEWVASGKLENRLDGSGNHSCHIMKFESGMDMHKFFYDTRLQYRQLKTKIRQIQLAYPVTCFFFDVIDNTPVISDPSWLEIKFSNINKELTVFDPSLSMFQLPSTSF